MMLSQPVGEATASAVDETPMASEVPVQDENKAPDTGDVGESPSLTSDGRGERPLFLGLREEWKTKKFSDVVVLCRDKVTIRTHRIVLAALSPMLKQALEGDEDKEDDSILLLPDLDSAEVKAFLERAYIGGMDEMLVTSAIEFLGFTDAIIMPDRVPIKEEGGDDGYYAREEREAAEDFPFDESSGGWGATPRRVQLKIAPSVDDQEEQLLAMRANDSRPVPRHLRSKPGTSHVWNFFRMTAHKTKVVCKECGRKFKNNLGITSTIARHLKNSHENLFAELQRMNAEEERKPTVPEVLSEEEVDAEQDKKPSRTLNKRSPVWTFFRDIGSEKATCLAGGCGKTFTTRSGTTSTLTRHLESKHPSQFEELKMMAQNKRIKQDPDDADEPQKNVFVTVDGVNQGTVVLKKVSAKKKNAIWNYFDKTDAATVHSCKACFKMTSSKGKSISALARHLRLNHERLHRQFLLDCGYFEEEVDTIVNKRTKTQATKPKAAEEDIASRTCPECGKVYSKRKGMLVHLDAVHSGRRPYVCEACGMSFSRKESFKRHNHDNFRPYLCSVCGKTFARRHIRDIHERAHYGDKRYPCNFCEKRFVTNQKRTIHERIHTGERPFPCSDCGKSFVQKHQLQTHMRIHTGARPYRCDSCAQMFRHLSTKAKHNCPGKPRSTGLTTRPTTTITTLLPQQQEQTTVQQSNQEDDQQRQYQGIEVYDTSKGQTIVL